jgi:hypothetical protein
MLPEEGSRRAVYRKPYVRFDEGGLETGHHDTAPVLYSMQVPCRKIFSSGQNTGKISQNAQRAKILIIFDPLNLSFQ